MKKADAEQNTARGSTGGGRKKPDVDGTGAESGKGKESTVIIHYGKPAGPCLKTVCGAEMEYTTTKEEVVNCADCLEYIRKYIDDEDV